jgi:hypothetical protein
VKLREVEDAINHNITEVWDSGADPIYLHLQPPEKVDVQDLIKTDNEVSESANSNTECKAQAHHRVLFWGSPSS